MKTLLGSLVLVGTFLIADVKAESYNFLELSQGVKVSSMPWGSSNWLGDYPTAFSIGVHWDLDRAYTRLSFRHESNLFQGKPFSKGESETWLDAVWFTYGIKF